MTYIKLIKYFFLLLLYTNITFGVALAEEKQIKTPIIQGIVRDCYSPFAGYTVLKLQINYEKEYFVYQDGINLIRVPKLITPTYMDVITPIPIIREEIINQPYELNLIPNITNKGNIFWRLKVHEQEYPLLQLIGRNTNA